MGICNKTSKAPIAFNTVNQLGNTASIGISKATKQARKLAARKARINKDSGIHNAPDFDGIKRLADSDSVPARTTEGRTRSQGGTKTIKANKSTAYYDKGDFNLRANVSGKLVTLGRRDTYTPEDKERIEREAQGYVKQTGLSYPDLTGNAHHATHRPVTFSQQLAIKPATGKANKRQYKTIDELLAE